MSDPKFSRRKFLHHTSLALTAAVAAPTLIPASAVGRNGTTAPSERINMGFIGIGGQGGGHLLGGAWTYVPGGYVARDDVQVLAVCDVRKERRDFAQRRCNEVYAQKFGRAGYHGVQAYNDFREVLARPDIDAVLVAVPYHWAATIAAMAMRAGKDVYCEKPIAITVREGLNMVETSKHYARIYQAGTQQRSEYGGKFRLACELIRNGRIGQLKEVYAYCLPGAFWPNHWTSDKSEPVPEGLDWEQWLGPLSWRPYTGKTGQELPGVIVGDTNWAPHHYDIIQWTINPDPGAPIEVTFDNGIIHYRYSNGVVVHSTGYPGEKIGPEGGACFVGTEGRIVLDRSNIVSYPSRILTEPLRPSDTRVYHADSHSGNFLDCIRSRRLTICDPETALYTMNAILIGGISLILRRSLKWDPIKAEFPDDAEANRLLSYTPRPPWRL
ncbi:MAG TPA: Gfo/Idh/MocA family oxidoreductase [Candidatus Binatia bacterium]|nr:Gfo/Idh/MocA family oxidoreductase [Candidatus Binatia bacterium]